MRASGRRAPILCGALLLCGAAPAPLPDREWRVGVFEAPPYATKDARGEWRGLTIDLWKEIAGELRLRYRFEEASPDSILEGIARGRFDVGAAPFAATIEREQLLDFSHAYAVSGLGIAVRRSGAEDRWLAVVEALTTPTALRLYVGVALLTFLAGTVLWLLERRRNPQFSGKRLEGVGSGFWWAGVTTVGVGYGDKVPITFWGRLTALLWMFISLILITALTAFVTAKLAVAELGQIHGAASLRATLVGTAEGSASADFLRRDRIPRRIYRAVPEALAALRKGEVRAVVYDAEILRYYAERDSRRRIEVLPGALESERYAFPLPDGSPLRDPVNQAMRRIMSEPSWRDLRDRYLGTDEATLGP